MRNAECLPALGGARSMCNALGIEPVITSTDTTSAAGFADLVEYCWGNASTPQGARRVADGHPEKYNVRYFELGCV